VRFLVWVTVAGYWILDPGYWLLFLWVIPGYKQNAFTMTIPGHKQDVCAIEFQGAKAKYHKEPHI
jgi:hypothetical protein